MTTENEERDLKIAAAYADGTPASRIASSFGLSVSHVRAVLAKTKAVKGVKHLTEAERVIDVTHLKIGNRLYACRFQRLRDAQQAADQIGWSVKRLRGVEKGTSALTLIDLQSIADYMDISLPDLFKNL